MKRFTILAMLLAAATALAEPQVQPRWDYAAVHLYLAHLQVYPYPLEPGDTFTVFVNHPNATAQHVVVAGENYVTVLLDLANQLQDALPDFYIHPDTGDLVILMQGQHHYRVRATYNRNHRQELEVIQ